MLCLLLSSVFPARQADASTASLGGKRGIVNAAAAKTSGQRGASLARTKKSGASETAAVNSAQQKKAVKRKPQSASRRPAPLEKARYKAALLFNASTGQTLYSYNPNRQVPPASLTKILSMFVAEDAIRTRKINPDAMVTISGRAAAAAGSRMGITKNDKVSLESLLHGMAVASGNDASIAVAEYIGGSEKRFVQMMNKKARSLGMTKSAFVNASGLPAPGQYTTAKDMLALARAYLAAYPGNLKKHHTHMFSTYKGHTTVNANPLLKIFQGADGLKTGFVNASGYNLISTAQRNGQRVIGVILGAPSKTARAAEAHALMEASFTNPQSLTAKSSFKDATATASKKRKKTAGTPAKNGAVKNTADTAAQTTLKAS
jgi:D-alanyl-D-alanine carboxypeptidase (penicillin-binding protein 5/6)